MDCVFCKIVNSEIPCYKIYEDDHALAFLDIAKDIDGHTVVVPKVHCRNILDCDNQILAHVINAVQKVSQHYVSSCGFQGVDILSANEPCAQQTVFHLHFHIIPRKENDGVNAWPKFDGCKMSLDEAYEMLKMG